MLDGEIDILPRTLDYYLTYSQLSFADCYHAALALEHCNGEIYTFDKDFRRVPGIARLEPGA
jgi:predicted nucleic acid-binding protein